MHYYRQLVAMLKRLFGTPDQGPADRRPKRESPGESQAIPQVHVYDKAKYHDGTIRKLGLPEKHAANHTVFFLQWLIEHDLMSAFFVQESGDVLQSFRTGKATIHEVYEWWDGCLIDEMLSCEGNVFAMHYFDFDHGRYLKDYVETLQGDLPTEFHVRYTSENYQLIRQVIDRRYEEWKKQEKSGENRR